MSELRVNLVSTFSKEEMAAVKSSQDPYGTITTILQKHRKVASRSFKKVAALTLAVNATGMLAAYVCENVLRIDPLFGAVPFMIAATPLLALTIFTGREALLLKLKIGAACPTPIIEGRALTPSSS